MARRSRTNNMIASSRDKEPAARVAVARDLLKRHLIHVREIPNGRDFMFLGPQSELHDALKTIMDVEHANSRFLRVDYVQVDKYFLFRVIGADSEHHAISTYFE